MTITQRWTQRPPGSNWGDFGVDDELGRINLINRQKILEGAKEIIEGKTFCLSLPLDVGYWLNPGRKGPVLSEVMVSEGQPMMNYPLRNFCAHYTDLTSDDAVRMDLQFSTQWDALGHVGSHFDAHGNGKPEPMYYNGYRAYEDIQSSVDYRKDQPSLTKKQNYLYKLGINRLAEAGMQGRGVMIDLYAHYGGKARSIGFRDIQEVLFSDKVIIEPGDILCIRTGIDKFILDNIGRTDMPDYTPYTSLNGRDQDLLQWITDCGVAAIVSDHPAVETYPPQEGPEGAHPFLGLHEHCLFKLGIPLGELWLLSPLADWLREHKRNRFFLTAPPLRLPGAAGSPVTRIATV